MHHRLPALIRPQSRRKEAHHIGGDEQPDRPGDQQPGRYVEGAAHPGIKLVIKGRKGHHQPHGNHPARHRIAQPRDIACTERQLARTQPLEEPHADCSGHGQHRRHPRQRGRVADEAQIARAQQVLL